jgi:hypothetical protein
MKKFIDVHLPYLTLMVKAIGAISDAATPFAASVLTRYRKK